MTDGDPAPNLRLHPRHRVLKAGKIVFSNLGASIDVTIKDMSTGGARVRVPPNIAIPKMFNLLVVSDGVLFPAELRWHRGESVGMKFVGEPRPTALKSK